MKKAKATEFGGTIVVGRASFNPWIPCSRKLPKGVHDSGYLVVVELMSGRHLIEVAQFYPGTRAKYGDLAWKSWWEIEAKIDEPYMVTHWMNLPELPGNYKK
jgi:hypothetical protein